MLGRLGACEVHGTGNGSGTGGPWEVHGRHVRCMGGASEGHGRCMGDWPTVLGILAWACRLFIRVGAVRSRPQRQRRHRRCPYAMALASARARAEAIGAASDALTPARRLARSRHPHAARRAQLAACSSQHAARRPHAARRCFRTVAPFLFLFAVATTPVYICGL